MKQKEILDRLKSKTYISLKAEEVVRILKQFPEDKQKQCFADNKSIKPLDNLTATAAIANIENYEEKIEKPLSKLTLNEKRAIVKNNLNELEDFLKNNGLWERAQLLKEKSIPGDFRPSKFWEVLDQLIPDYELIGD